jgi:hypothetical protein
MSNPDSFWSWSNYLRFLAAAAIAYGCSRLHGIERAIRELRVEVRVINSEVQPWLPATITVEKGMP